MSGIYFDPGHVVFQRRMACLSGAYSGHVIAVLHTKEHRGMMAGKFRVDGVYLPSSARNLAVLRNACYLAYFLLHALTLRRRGRIDLIVVKDAFKNGLVALLLKKLCGIPFVVDIVGNHVRAVTVSPQSSKWRVRTKLWLIRTVSPLVLRHAAGVKLLYEEQLNDLGLDAGALPHRTFHEFVPVSLFSPGRSAEPRYVFFAGGPWYLKGVDLLIEAFQLIEDRFPDLRLKVVGYTPDRERFEAMARGDARIELGRQVPYEELRRLMRGCCLFVLPSRSEAMGSVLLEAMASGKPIVASDTDGIPTYVRDGRNGLLFRTGDSSDLARKMERVLADPDLSRRLAETGRRMVQELFSEERYAQSFVKLIEDAAKRR